MENQNKEKIIIALRKAATSLEKILARVEEEDAACFPIIQQNLSVIGLLKSVNTLMLENHMEREMSKYDGHATKHMRTLQDEILKIVKLSQKK